VDRPKGTTSYLIIFHGLGEGICCPLSKRAHPLSRWQGYIKNTLGVKGVLKSVVRVPFRFSLISTRGLARCSLFLSDNSFATYTLHPTHCTQSPTPYTLHPTACTPHPTPYTPHPTFYILHPTPYTLHPRPVVGVDPHAPKPWTPTPEPQTLSFWGQPQPPAPFTPSPKPCTLHPSPESRDPTILTPQFSTLKPKPCTLNTQRPTPCTLDPALLWLSVRPYTLHP